MKFLFFVYREKKMLLKLNYKTTKTMDNFISLTWAISNKLCLIVKLGNILANETKRKKI